MYTLCMHVAIYISNCRMHSVFEEKIYDLMEEIIARKVHLIPYTNSYMRLINVFPCLQIVNYTYTCIYRPVIYIPQVQLPPLIKAIYNATIYGICAIDKMQVCVTLDILEGDLQRSGGGRFLSTWRLAEEYRGLYPI